MEASLPGQLPEEEGGEGEGRLTGIRERKGRAEDPNEEPTAATLKGTSKLSE